MGEHGTSCFAILRTETQPVEFLKLQLSSKIWQICLMVLPIVAKLKKDKMYGS